MPARTTRLRTREHAEASGASRRTGNRPPRNLLLVVPLSLYRLSTRRGNVPFSLSLSFSLVQVALTIWGSILLDAFPRMGCLAPRWTRRPLPRRARRAQIPRGGAPPLRFDPGSVRRAGEPTNADVAAGKAPAGEFLLLFRSARRAALITFFLLIVSFASSN